MIEYLSNRIADACCKQGIAKPADREIYVFGSNALMKYALNLVIPFVLAVVFSIWLEIAVFLVTYCNLRRYAGGYHAKTELKCFVISQFTVVVFSAVVLLANFIPLWVSLLVVIPSAIIILILSPVETANNPLTEAERKTYRKRSQIICISYLTFFCLCTFLNSRLDTVLMCTFLSMAIHLLFGTEHSKYKS